MKFSELLIKLNACKEAREWALDMPIEEIVEKCHRGDWLLWLARNVNIDKRKFTLAKSYCANTVRYLMKDERSTNSIDVAIRYGNGQATDDELNAAAADAADAAAAADAAYAAAAAADAAAADAAADAAYAAADAAAADAADAAAAYAAAAAAYAAADAAYAAAAAADAAAADAAAAYAAAADARKVVRKETSDICRQYIGSEIIKKVNELL